jgi:hypothetical protein
MTRKRLRAVKRIGWRPTTPERRSSMTSHSEDTMPHDHASLVEISGKIAANIGLWRHWPDPIPPWGRGEHPDRFGLFNRSSDVLWTDDDHNPVPLRYGDTMLFECKASREDFYADADKPWRQPGAYAIGNFRAFVAPFGVLEPRDLLHLGDTPWGLWLVNEDGEFLMSHAPRRVHMVNRSHELMLLAKLVTDSGHGQGAAPRTGKRQGLHLQPYYHDFIHGLLVEHGELEIGYVAKLLRDRDPSKVTSIQKALAMIRGALDAGEMQGIESIQSGQDVYLALREAPQAQEAT